MVLDPGLRPLQTASLVLLILTMLVDTILELFLVFSSCNPHGLVVSLRCVLWLAII